MKFYGIEMDGPMILEKLDVLPEFDVESDIGRYIYLSSEMGGVVYYGSQTEWVRLLITDDVGTAIDEINDHINDLNNPHQVTSVHIGATPLTTFNAHLADTNDPHNTVNLIETQLVPPGAVLYFARNTAPTGYLVCNGSIVSRTTYANLFSAIGTTFGAGDGTTTFGLPNLLGEFIRGWDAGRGVDSGRALGSAQSDAFKSHMHTLEAATDESDNGPKVRGGGSLTTTGTSVTSYVGGTETRPRNVALLPCIKF